MYAQRRLFQCESDCRSLCVQISRERSYPLPIYWYQSKGIWLRYNFAADSFYIMKLCSRLFVLYYRNCPKDDKFWYLIPILRKFQRRTLVDGLLESPCRLLINCNWTSFSISYPWGTRRQNVSKCTAFWWEWVSLSQDFRGKGPSLGNIFCFLKTRHILLSDCVNCTMLWAVVLTQYRRVMDGQTDGIAVANTALAMWSLQRPVKIQR